ncbi:MAG: 2Fe-2S iron-sulfur cluster binding domain-containing protein [Rhodospirillaceae bacterium]|nr:2Fe-2S iron-sulfur cluster binding domain-containing protein [Rhodospirillaceae bacterium]
MKTVTIEVNGERFTQAVDDRVSLADFLRDGCRQTGTHIGCEHGVCGACTILLDGEPVRSCITLAAAADGAAVRTVEGYAGDALMAAIRQAFNRRHALQCGFCTPGMLATAYDIATRLPEADRARIKTELAGNLCRCTGYLPIVAAIEDVLAARKASGAPSQS